MHYHHSPANRPHKGQMKVEKQEQEKRFLNRPENRTIEEILRSVDEPISPESIQLFRRKEGQVQAELDSMIQRMLQFSRPDITINEAAKRLRDSKVRLS